MYIRNEAAAVVTQTVSAISFQIKLIYNIEYFNSSHLVRSLQVTYLQTQILRYISLFLELASSDDSDMERNYPSGSYIWQPDSDSESIDSESEDIFK